MGRSLRFKLVGVFAIMVGTMLADAGLSMVTSGVARTDVTSLSGTYVPATRALGDLHTALAEFHGDQVVIVGTNDQAIRSATVSEMARLQTEVVDAFDSLAALQLTPDEQARYTTAKADWESYVALTSGLTALDNASDLTGFLSGSPQSAYTRLDGDVDKLYEALTGGASAAASNADFLITDVPIFLAGGSVIAITLGALLVLLLSRSMLSGLRDVRQALASMAEQCVGSLEAGLAAMADNNLTVRVASGAKPIERHGKDEIGQIADATNAMLVRLGGTIASYEQARVSLSAALAEVHSAAQSVSVTASEVNGAAVQSGHGSQQIARTIGQVAAGAADQAHAATETSNAVTELQAVIEQVRGGASQTASSVETQAGAVNEMTRSIRSASRASSDVHNLGSAAGEAAANGASTVRLTVDGMSRIKSAVEGAAVKVTELGAKGDQIGAIVETIDDIAEQTNLLALNAAIEAARAGEQGKGFAVVADEVRKLAERSSRATKEIAALISEVQQGTQEAVKAMQIGAREVESGAELAARSGAALDEIASAVSSSNAAVDRIVRAMDSMQTASAGLVTASDAIAAIAQETSAAAESMSGSAQRVAGAVDSIAAISEENSASAEEVSAATEQMSAQSEEVVASATTLSEMAARLETLAARFRLDDGSGAADSGAYGEPAGLPVESSELRRRRAA